MSPYYSHAGIEIYHGDCREILPQLNGGGMVADLILTDPPYGLNIAAQPFNYQRARGMQKEAWDAQPVSDLLSILAFAPESVVWGGNYYALPPSRGWLCWRKPDRLPSMADFELAWTSKDMNARMVVETTANTNKERVGHFCQKPLSVMLFSLSFFPCASSICDPFMGTGTALVAAKTRQRSAIGIEIEERYCEIAARRLGQDLLPFGGQS